MITAQLPEKRQPVTVDTAVYRLLKGQRVEYQGEVRKVARVFPCLSRAQGGSCELRWCASRLGTSSRTNPPAVQRPGKQQYGGSAKTIEL